MKRSVWLALIAVLPWQSTLSAELPRASADDPRVRLVTYAPNQVTVVKVRRGTVTRITLAPDEQIDVAVTGLSARCDKDDDEWCIRADKGGNQIFVRPKDGARRNNMELRTSARDYSIEFDVLQEPSSETKSGKGVHAPSAEADGFYRVAFEYAPPKPQATANQGSASAAAARLLAAIDASSGGKSSVPAIMPVTERLTLEPPQVRNGNYTMQVLEKGEDAAPSLVFDDGRFTYFEFLGAREIPAIYAYGSDDAPSRVNWHMQGHFVVVERTARKFTLRLGDSVTGVFNEAFDPVGIDTPTGTISVSVRRQISSPAGAASNTFGGTTDSNAQGER